MSETAKFETLFFIGRNVSQPHRCSSGRGRQRSLERLAAPVAVGALGALLSRHPHRRLGAEARRGCPVLAAEAGWLPVRRLQLDGPKLEHANSRGSRHITTAALVVRILGGSGLGFRHAYRGFLRFFSASFGVLSDGGVRLSENPAVSFGILRYPRRAWGPIFRRIPRYPSVSLAFLGHDFQKDTAVSFGILGGVWKQKSARIPAVSFGILLPSRGFGLGRPGEARYPSVSLVGFGPGNPGLGALSFGILVRFWSWISTGFPRYPSVSFGILVSFCLHPSQQIRAGCTPRPRPPALSKIRTECTQRPGPPAVFFLFLLPRFRV